MMAAAKERKWLNPDKFPTVHDGDKEYCLIVGSSSSDRSATAYLMQFDGAAQPNPGLTSSGAVLWGSKNASGVRSRIVERGEFYGDRDPMSTNNVAESKGLLLGLEIAAEHEAKNLFIEGDSMLIICQQTQVFEVKNKRLKSCWEDIQAKMKVFEWIAICHVDRQYNTDADSITKEVLKTKKGFKRMHTQAEQSPLEP